jgi:hypothetical protein
LRAARALTLVELMIAISLMSAVMLALSTFMSATAVAWKSTDHTRKTSINTNRIDSRLSQVLRPALTAVALPVGSQTPTALMYWSYDSIGGTADNKIAKGELGLFIYDSTTRTLLHYAPSTSFSTSDLPTASSTSLGDLTQASTINLLKSMPFLQPPEVIAGPNVAAVDTPVGATVVSGVAFQTSVISGAKPIIRYQVDLGSTAGELDQRLVGSVYVRSPVTATNLP